MQKLVSSITLSATLAALGIAAGLLLGSLTPSDAGNASLTPRPPQVRDHREKPVVRDHTNGKSGVETRDHRNGDTVHVSKSTVQHPRRIPCYSNLC